MCIRDREEEGRLEELAELEELMLEESLSPLDSQPASTSIQMDAQSVSAQKILEIFILTPISYRKGPAGTN